MAEILFDPALAREGKQGSRGIQQRQFFQALAALRTAEKIKIQHQRCPGQPAFWEFGEHTWKFGCPVTKVYYMAKGIYKPPAKGHKFPSLVDAIKLDRLKTALRGGCTPRRAGSALCPPGKSLQHPKQHLQRKCVQKKLSFTSTAINRAGPDVTCDALHSCFTWEPLGNDLQLRKDFFKIFIIFYF